MADIQDRPELIRDPTYDVSRLSFIGIRLGMPATALDKDRITEVSFSPLAQSIQRRHGQPTQYSGPGGRALELSEARASVVYGTGVLHTIDDLSFTIFDARIERVSLYGRWVTMFQGLDTLEKLYHSFGRPAACFRLEAEGDEIGCDCYYAASSKWLRWAPDLARPSFVVYGTGIGVSAGRHSGLCRVRVDC